VVSKFPDRYEVGCAVWRSQLKHLKEWYAPEDAIKMGAIMIITALIGESWTIKR